MLFLFLFLFPCPTLLFLLFPDLLVRFVPPGLGPDDFVRSALLLFTFADIMRIVKEVVSVQHVDTNKRSTAIATKRQVKIIACVQLQSKLAC